MEEEDASRFIPSPKNTQKAKTKQDALKTGDMGGHFHFHALLLLLASSIFGFALLSLL
ncbi:unnamed protein product [Prunus armeniaca]|uniref:Uncharacterized protein n=1 Tax=Prunus armeniaca TaxID=36596 RepID=A0A6J5XVD7_PRUAR|nr:unnamed protein product [Prunus armeniaca]